MEDSLTIADVVADPSLDTWIISGHSGITKPVLWAHSCEMPDPSQWLQPHELLMTTGICVPAGDEAQRRFIAALDAAGLAGITIGQDGLAPPLTEAMMDESRQRGFPLLRTGPSTPFVAVARMVASSNSNKQTMAVLRLAKLYRIAAHRTPADRRSAASLRKLFATDITVVDVATGCVIIGQGLLGPVEARSHPLRTLRKARLILGDDSRLDALSLVHLSQVLEVDANEIIQGAMKKISEDTASFEGALAGRLEARSALENLWEPGHTGYRVIATACEVERRLPLTLALAAPDTLTTCRDGKQLIAAAESKIEPVKTLLRELGVHAGASAVHFDPADLEAAVVEARSEFTTAAANECTFSEFRGERVSLLARSKTERRQIVQSVLGPLASHEARIASLRETLFTFLDHDLQWNETAETLQLHRQTVVYRLDRVEQITGRSVRRTKDLAELWLARTSWDSLEDDCGP